MIGLYERDVIWITTYHIYWDDRQWFMLIKVILIMGLSESDIIKYCAKFFEKEKEKRLA